MTDRSAEFAVETSTSRALFLSTPTKAREFFNSSFVRWHPAELDSAGVPDAISAYKLQPDLSPSHHRCPQE